MFPPPPRCLKNWNAVCHASCLAYDDVPMSNKVRRK